MLVYAFFKFILFYLNFDFNFFNADHAFNPCFSLERSCQPQQKTILDKYLRVLLGNDQTNSFSSAFLCEQSVKKKNKDPFCSFIYRCYLFHLCNRSIFKLMILFS